MSAPQWRCWLSCQLYCWSVQAPLVRSALACGCTRCTDDIEWTITEDSSCCPFCLTCYNSSVVHACTTPVLQHMPPTGLNADCEWRMPISPCTAPIAFREPTRVVTCPISPLATATPIPRRGWEGMLTLSSLQLTGRGSVRNCVGLQHYIV